MKPSPSVECADNNNLDVVWAHCTEIAEKMDYPSFFCSGEWLKSSAEKLSAGDTLFILLVKQEGCVIAVLPLVQKNNALGGKDFRFLGTDFYPDPIGLISAMSDRAACTKLLKEYLLEIPGWDRFFLDSILEDELVEWNISGSRTSVAPYMLLPENFTDVLGEFKQKKRYNLRSMVRKFMEIGGRMVTSTNLSSHEIFLEALLELHKKRAKEKAIKSSMKGKRVRAFHEKIIKKAESNVRFYGLSLNHQLVAVIYGFEFRNRFFYYQVAHDPVYKNLSPGSVLLFLVIEDCCSRRLTEFNFLQGDESYKGIWTDKSRILYRGVLERGNWRSFTFSVSGLAREILKSVLVKKSGN